MAVAELPAAACARTQQIFEDKTLQIEDSSARQRGDGGREIRTAPALYEADIQRYLGMWRAEHRPVEVDEILCIASPNQPANRLLRDYALKEQKIKASEFDAGMRKVHVEAQLDGVPRSASHYIELLEARDGLTLSGGRLRRNSQPHNDITYGDGSIIRYMQTEANEQACEVLKAYGDHFFRGYLPLDDFRLQARTLAAELRLPFSRDEINDAVALWCSTARRQREFDLRNSIDMGPTERERTAIHAGLLALCETAFDTAEQSAEYASAVIRKFIWQVRRKMIGLPVTNHAMPVLLGRQGGGKSTFVRLMTAPLFEMTASTDFREITDQRNIALWRNLILFIDEMGWASKSDIDTVKNVITAETLTRRPMNTNGYDQVDQRATLIGRSNKESLSDLIRDPTGVRRFLSLRFGDHPDWSAINGFDWLAVWRAIDPRATDPMQEVEVREIMEARQEADRERSNVEQWLASINPTRSLHGALRERRTFTAAELYLEFREWEDEYAPGTLSSVTRFGLDMRQVHREGRSCFQPRRTSQGSHFDYTGPKGLRAVSD